MKLEIKEVNELDKMSPDKISTLKSKSGTGQTIFTYLFSVG